MARHETSRLKVTTQINLADANLDERTLKYIEYIAEEKGQKALDKYLTYVGWRSSEAMNVPPKQCSIEKRLKRAKHWAETITWKHR